MAASIEHPAPPGPPIEEPGGVPISSDAALEPSGAGPAPAARPRREVIYRHTLVVRLTHWINVVAVSLLLMSGLQIFNAYPRLHWGAFGADADHAWLELTAEGPNAARPTGLLDVGGARIVTTGLLGVSRGRDGAYVQRGFPRWATLPSDRDLATGRRWHFFLAWVFVANGLIYLLFGLINRHFRRDLAPTGDELKPRAILRDIGDHLRFKHPAGEAAKRYNVLQKLTYLAVIFVVLPLMVLTGLTMSPGVDAAAPWLLSLFGGRPSARSIHFITANLIVLFVIVHVVEVFIAGVGNELGSMITGRYAIRPELRR